MSKNWEQLGLRPHLSKNERLPRSYKEVEKVLKDVKACKGNLKTVLNNSRLRGPVFKKVYSLATNILKYRNVLDRIIQETELLEKEKFLREELAGILIYELVLGKGLPGESRPVAVIKQYEDDIRKAYEKAMKDGNLNVKGLQSLPRYVRVNTLLTSVADVLKNLRRAEYREVYYGESISEKEYLDLVRNLEPGNFLIDYHFKDLLVFASTENLTAWSLYQKKHVYLQDKSSYIPVYALDPKPGSVIIDACAAPGMKTIHIASAMENNGKIYAYEKSESRFQILKEMTESASVKICEAECVDFYMVNANDPKFQDLECILVDPSCSGSGMVNRMDTVTDTEDSKNNFRLQKLAGFQILLLKHALTFPSVKRVVYSTCSISEEENEYVVHEVLNHFRHIFKLVSVMPNWQIRGSDNFEYGRLCLRAYPEETLTNGFFVAMFERLDYDEQLNASKPFLDKSSKKKRKRRENLEKGDNAFKLEPQDNQQFLDDTSSVEARNLLKEKKRKYTDFNQDHVENEDGHVQLENGRKKKKKHSDKTGDNFESMTDTHVSVCESTSNISGNSSNILKSSFTEKRIEKESLNGNDGIVERLHENTLVNAEDAEDSQNFNCNKNSFFPAESSFTNHSKKKKKKHKKELFIHEDNKEIYDKKNSNVEQSVLENELFEEEAEIKIKKHKHKKKHSKEKVELYENTKYAAENNLPECKTTSESDNTTPKKKHKKHSEEDLIDLSSEISQDIEETSLKKKHKKKCKDKKSKEE